MGETVVFKKTIGGATAFVTVFDGLSGPAEYSLASFGKAMITFGRDEKNDIVIKSQYVSRQHGCFRLFNGEWLIEDNPASTNGLIFNDEAIQSKIMEDGDSIRFEKDVGDVVLVFSKGAKAEWKTFETKGQSVITIGRGPACQIRLDHISVSQVHAEIFVRDGQYFLRDTGSTNGVVLNGQKVIGSCPLNEKDLIVITNSKLVFSSQRISYNCFKKGIGIDVVAAVKQVAGGKTICNEVNLNVQSCELVAIIGGSGAGKSTVMNLMSGFTRPTSGTVALNGMNLHENLETLKNIIGYVPQQDIVHDKLTVFDMLNYAARLKLPEDVTESECQQAIGDAIKAVDLVAHKDTIIKDLSGGQRKRASIALELLSDPNVFFLDEPASGLDPGTEKMLMETLKAMASKGKTIVFVTHSTLNLQICDKVAFMGRGGNLCYYGPFNDALKFFGVDNIVDVYAYITNEPEKWKAKFQQAQKSQKQPQGTGVDAKENKESSSRKWLKQLMILTKRYMHILVNDKNRILLAMMQAPVLAGLIAVAANVTNYTNAPTIRNGLIIYLVLAATAFWVGISNSMQEICKERNILKREYMSGLRLSAYVFSKIIVMTLLCGVQSLLMVSVFALGVGLPKTGVFLVPYLELLITTFLATLAAAGIGIFVSSLVKDSSKANLLATMLMIPQLLFAGGTFHLRDGALQPISYATVCRWSFEAYGATANFTKMFEHEGRALGQAQFEEAIALAPVEGRAFVRSNEGLRLEMEASGTKKMMEDYRHRGVNFKSTQPHLILTWLIMSVFVALFSFASIAVLRNLKKEGNY